MKNKLFKISWKYKLMRPMNSNTHETYMFIQNEDEAVNLISNINVKDILKIEQVVMEGIIVTKKNMSWEGPYEE